MATALHRQNVNTGSGEEHYEYIRVGGVAVDVGDMLAGKTFAIGSNGTATPAAGQRGEVIAQSVSTATNAAATTAYLALASVALTPGIWLISGVSQLNVNGATMTQTANTSTAIGTTTASATGTVAGQTILAENQASLVDPMSLTITIPPFLATITSATSYFLNVACTYSAGQPQYVGSISAVRIA